MSSDPKEEEAGRVSGQLSGSFLDYPHVDPERRLGYYQLRGYTPEKIQSLLNQAITGEMGALEGERNRAVGRTTDLNVARGMSLGVNDPYKYARRAATGVYESFNPRFSALNVARARSPLDSISTMLNINQQNLRPFLALLELMQGNVGNRAGNVGASAGLGALNTAITGLEAATGGKGFT